MKTSNILPQSINFDDESYSISPGRHSSLSKNHAESINRIGLLHPPILKESMTGEYIVVCGRKRLLHISNQRNLANCSCLIIPETYDHLQTWNVILADMLLEAPLTAIEKAIFFKKILLVTEIDTVATLFLPMLELSPNTFQIKKLLPLAELAEPIKVAIQCGSLDPKSAIKLASLSFRDSLALFDMLDNLHLSVGNQRKFISSIVELEKRKNSNILTLLTTPEIQTIINSGQNIPQKAATMMKYLTLQISPQLTSAENDFKEFANNLKLPKSVNLSHSPSFEQDSLTLAITFKDKGQFLNFWHEQKESLICQQ